MNAVDATFLPSVHFEGSSDQYLTLIFDTSSLSEAPTTDEVRAHVVDRARDIDALHRRVVNPAGHLDYPMWVVDPTDVRLRVVAAADGCIDWATCVDRLAALSESALDPTRHTWRLHVFPEVTGAPGCAATATVIVLQLSHTLVDGRGAMSLARALFGADASAETPSVRAATHTPGRAELAVRSLGRCGLRSAGAPAALIESTRASRRSRALQHRGALPPDPTRRPPAGFNNPPGPRRAVSLVSLPVRELKLPGLTVTHGALTAVSIAMERFARDHDDPAACELGAHVTVGVPAGVRWSANNRFLPAMVCLGTGSADVRERGARIKASLDGEIARLSNPDVLRQFDVPNRVPRPVLRAMEPRSSARPASVLAHTSVTSLNRGPADLSLCGAPAVSTAGFPALSPAGSISHGLYTLGDTATFSVLTAPESFADAEDYPQYLREALDDVRASVNTKIVDPHTR